MRLARTTMAMAFQRIKARRRFSIVDVPGAARFLRRLNGVHVAGVGRKRQINAVLARVLEHFFDE